MEDERRAGSCCSVWWRRRGSRSARRQLPPVKEARRTHLALPILQRNPKPSYALRRPSLLHLYSPFAPHLTPHHPPIVCSSSARILTIERRRRTKVRMPRSTRDDEHPRPGFRDRETVERQPGVREERRSAVDPFATGMRAAQIVLPGIFVSSLCGMREAGRGRTEPFHLRCRSGTRRASSRWRCA